MQHTNKMSNWKIRNLICLHILATCLQIEPQSSNFHLLCFVFIRVLWSNLTTKTVQTPNRAITNWCSTSEKLSDIPFNLILIEAFINGNWFTFLYSVFSLLKTSQIKTSLLKTWVNIYYWLKLLFYVHTFLVFHL